MLMPSGKVLVVGGFDGGAVSSAEPYDPAANTWSAAGSLATVRNFHTATLLLNGKVIAAGGWNNEKVLASTDIYDPVANSWSAAGSLAVAREAHTATLLSNGKVLVVGGFDATNALASAELYDPAANTWSSAGSVMSARYFHTATLLPNGKVLVAEGRMARMCWPALSSTTRSRTPGLLQPACWPPATPSLTVPPSGKVLVVGGFGVAGALASVERYDPAANAWTPQVVWQSLATITRRRCCRAAGYSSPAGAMPRTF